MLAHQGVDEPVDGEQRALDDGPVGDQRQQRVEVPGHDRARRDHDHRTDQQREHDRTSGERELRADAGDHQTATASPCRRPSG